MTAKILYLVKRARPDIETLVSFLTMRVTKSDTDDWKKLNRGLTFVKNTIKDKRIIGAKKLTDLYTWIDAAYAVHNNMRGYTGGAISMGYGIMHRNASKTKDKRKKFHRIRVGRNGRICPIQNMVYDVHGCTRICDKNNIIYEDNKSTIIM